MIARILPPEEWDRVRHNAPMLADYVNPGDVALVVVEEGERIVATMTVMRATHFEGAWIDPGERNGGVTRSLLNLAVDVARGWGQSWAFGGAQEGPAGDQMRGILTRLKGRRMPVEFHALPLGGD